jgi:hypothetical protein
MRRKIYKELYIYIYIYICVCVSHPQINIGDMHNMLSSQNLGVFFSTMHYMAKGDARGGQSGPSPHLDL